MDSELKFCPFERIRNLGQAKHPEFGKWGKKRSLTKFQKAYEIPKIKKTVQQLWSLLTFYTDSLEPVLGTVIRLFTEKWFDNVRQEKLAEIVRNARRCRRLTLSVKSDRLDLSLRSSCNAAQGFVWCVLSQSSVLLIKACQLLSTTRGPGNCLEGEGGRRENTFAVRDIFRSLHQETSPLNKSTKNIFVTRVSQVCHILI